MAVTITADEVRHAASLPKREGRVKLLCYLKWEMVDEETHLRQTIHLDYLYDHLMFAAEKGFPWSHILHVLSTAEELITGTKDIALVEAVKYYSKVSKPLLQCLGERNYKLYTEFVFSTFFAHYKLYQYVFTFPREEQIPHIETVVVTPPVPENLGEGKLEEVWEYDKKYQAVEEKERQKAEEWDNELQKVAVKSAEMKSTALGNVHSIEGPIDKECVAKIIKEILGASAASTTEYLKTAIGQSMEELQCKLERTLIPRPEAMGPPPRFNPKTPLQVAEVIPAVPVAQPPTKAEKPRSKSRESTKSMKSNKSNKA